MYVSKRVSCVSTCHIKTYVCKFQSGSLVALRVSSRGIKTRACPLNIVHGVYFELYFPGNQDLQRAAGLAMAATTFSAALPEKQRESYLAYATAVWSRVVENGDLAEDAPNYNRIDVTAMWMLWDVSVVVLWGVVLRVLLAAQGARLAFVLYLHRIRQCAPAHVYTHIFTVFLFCANKHRCLATQPYRRAQANRCTACFSGLKTRSPHLA